MLADLHYFILVILFMYWIHKDFQHKCMLQLKIFVEKRTHLTWLDMEQKHNIHFSFNFNFCPLKSSTSSIASDPYRYGCIFFIVIKVQTTILKGNVLGQRVLYLILCKWKTAWVWKCVILLYICNYMIWCYGHRYM